MERFLIYNLKNEKKIFHAFVSHKFINLRLLLVLSLRSRTTLYTKSTMKYYVMFDTVLPITGLMFSIFLTAPVSEVWPPFDCISFEHHFRIYARILKISVRFHPIHSLDNLDYLVSRITLILNVNNRNVDNHSYCCCYLFCCL